MSIYLNEITNYRNSVKWLSAKVSEVIEVIENKAICEHDQDLELMIVPDLEFEIFKKAYLEAYEELPDYAKSFCPEQEYGRVETMSKSEMNGFQY